ncbi:prephenate dehydratase [Achromatium sp. WMS3]|nr:prephenate dehydratase [Achromatium sp. WMS3]
MSSINTEPKLQKIRIEIDSLDAQILQLINQRAAIAQKVAKIKHEYNAKAVRIYRPEREAQILHRLKTNNPGPLDNDTIIRLFKEIISACLALEQPLRVAYLGPAGTFTQTATLKHFGHAIDTIPVATIPDVFRDVESGACQYGVVPIENSTEGVINHTLDMFIRSPLRICGEICLRIHQHLLSHCESFNQIKRIYSHPQSFAQCRGWLERHLPQAKHLSSGSNAEAVRQVAEETCENAAIAGEAAAELYNVNILARNLEDEPSNTTRFLVIGNNEVPISGRDKTSLLMACQNEVGGLHGLLEPFAQQGISMTRIESRPSRTSLWEYVFFVDFEGHKDDPKTQQAFALLKQRASLLKVLGSYPIAEN